MVRSDYEHCIGGIGAALIADHEDTLHINELLRQSRDIFECEKHNEQAIKELKVTEKKIARFESYSFYLFLIWFTD